MSDESTEGRAEAGRREYAAAALIGILSNPEHCTHKEKNSDIARQCLDIADALVKAGG